MVDETDGGVMPDEDDFQALISKRRQEAQAEQTRANEAARAQREREVRINTLLLNMQSQVIPSLLVIAAQYGGKLEGVGVLNVAYDQTRCQVRYSKLGGGGGCDSAGLDFELQESGEVVISSTFGRPDTRPLSELTYPVLEEKVKAFVKSALS